MFRVLPWSMKADEYPRAWPDAVGRYWVQAQRSLRGANWDAAAAMARQALRAALRGHDAPGATLREQIEHVGAAGLLPPVLRDWAWEMPNLDADELHANGAQPPDPAHAATDLVRFLEFLLEYLYELPARIRDHRRRSERPQRAAVPTPPPAA